MEKKLPLNVQQEVKKLVSIYKKGLTKEAWIKAVILLEKNPNSAFILNISGMINIDLNEHEKALDFFSKSIELNKNFAEAYNNKGSTLHYLGRLKEAIDCFKTAIKLKPEYFSAYNNMGVSLNEIGEWDSAIKNYTKAIEIKPDYNEAYNNLIKILTFYDPIKKVDSTCVNVNKILQLKKFNFNSKKMISDIEIINFYKDSNEIIKKNLNNIDYNLSQIYRRNTIDLKCKRHFEVFNNYNIIPKYCFGCYKVQIEPRNVMELFKLFFIFDTLNLAKNNTRKCLIEMRKDIKGTYKGLIYCFSLDEANEIKKKISLLIIDQINKSIPILIKRGCSEFAISYPDYKEIKLKGEQKMKYRNEWKSKEIIIDNKLKKTNNTQKVVKDSLNGITLNDILIMRNWLRYAKKIGDLSYQKIDDNFSITPYIENQLSSQISTRIKEFNLNL